MFEIRLAVPSNDEKTLAILYVCEVRNAFKFASEKLQQFFFQQAMPCICSSNVNMEMYSILE